MSLCEKDFDECTASTDRCHALALCQNTPASYACQCRKGWTGNGRNCSGKYDYVQYKGSISSATPYSVECISFHVIC